MHASTRPDSHRMALRPCPVHGSCGIVMEMFDCYRVYTRYSRLSNRFDNWLYRVYKHLTGCQTGLITDLTTGCIV